MEKKKKVTCKNYTLLLCQSVFIVRIDSYILMMKIHSGIRSKEANQIVECGSKSCCVEHKKKKKKKTTRTSNVYCNTLTNTNSTSN